MTTGIKGLQALINQYESNQGGNFEKVGWLKGLKDDGDTITARILCKGIIGQDEYGQPIYDLPIYEVHNMEIDGWKRDIKAIGDNDAISLTGSHPSLKVYIPLYIEGAEVPIQIWKRGINDIKKLLSLIEEYGDLNARDFKIKRIGKKGSTKTTYEFYAKDKEEKELPQMPKILDKKSWFLLDLTNEEMQQVVNGTFTLKGDVEATTTSNEPITSAF